MEQQVYNPNLIAILVFILILFTLLWIMPAKKSGVVIKRMTKLINAFPISKIFIHLINSFESKKK